MENIDDKLLNSLAVKILDDYKDGEFAYNDDETKQSQGHYNAKRACMKNIKEIFANTKNTKFVETLLKVMLISSDEPFRELKRKYHDVIKEKHNLEKKVLLLERGQDGSKCGLCYYNVRDAIKAGIDTHITESEDVMRLTEKVNSLRSRLRIITEKHDVKEKKLKDIADNHHTIPNSEYYDLVNELATFKSSPAPKGEPKCKKDYEYKSKYKKMKKKLAKVEAELLLLRAQQTSDSDSGSDSGSD
tara:strand:+ start:13259 stop:13993 length:735 start_codon:yes stop_codon:yes gene_type:complete